MAQHVQLGDGPPVAPPSNYGQHYIDESSGDEYRSVGVESVVDWRKTAMHSAGFRIDSAGRLQMPNDTTGLWHTLGLRNNADGLVEIYVETGVA